MSLIYEQETHKLRRCFFDVQNDVGLGKQEKGYQEGCELWLRENDVPFAARAPHHLRLHDRIVHTLRPDLVVADKITVELKAEPRKLQNSDFVQLFNYLKLRKDRLGLLVNMGLTRVEAERVPYAQPEHELSEDWQYWSGRIAGRDREVGAELRDGLHLISDAHGTGYDEGIVRKLISSELGARGLKYVNAPVAKSLYRGVVVDESPLDCMLVEGRIVLVFTALLADNEINIGRGKSYMQALGVEWGVAANFGKKAAQFTGLHVAS